MVILWLFDRFLVGYKTIRRKNSPILCSINKDLWSFLRSSIFLWYHVVNEKVKTVSRYSNWAITISQYLKANGITFSVKWKHFFTYKKFELWFTTCIWTWVKTFAPRYYDYYHNSFHIEFILNRVLLLSVLRFGWVISNAPFVQIFIGSGSNW